MFIVPNEKILGIDTIKNKVLGIENKTDVNLLI